MKNKKNSLKREGLLEKVEIRLGKNEIVINGLVYKVQSMTFSFDNSEK